jgi:hypothetical protein
VGVVEALPTQPYLVQAGPRLAIELDAVMAKKQFGQPVPYPHEIRAGVRAGPHQITHRLQVGLGNGDRGDLTSATRTMPIEVSSVSMSSVQS